MSVKQTRVKKGTLFAERPSLGHLFRKKSQVLLALAVRHRQLLLGRWVCLEMGHATLIPVTHLRRDSSHSTGIVCFSRQATRQAGPLGLRPRPTQAR